MDMVSWKGVLTGLVILAVAWYWSSLVASASMQEPRLLEVAGEGDGWCLTPQVNRVISEVARKS